MPRSAADANAITTPKTDAPLNSIPWNSLTPLLRTTGAIHSLRDAQSERKLRAKPTGIVTHARAGSKSVYITQDGKGMRIAARQRPKPRIPAIG